MLEIYTQYSEYGELFLRVFLASLLGGLVGLERDMHGRAAGLRTHLLVCMGASVFTILSELVASKTHSTGFVADPARISAQVVTGIGFLGAGVILKEGIKVRGLTTAACLWVAAAIGMATGGGFYGIAIVTTAIALVSLSFLKLAENYYAKDSYRVMIIKMPVDVSASCIIEHLKSKQLQILSCDIEKNYETGVAVARLSIRLHHRGIADKLAHGIIDSLEKSPLRIKEIKWRHL